MPCALLGTHAPRAGGKNRICSKTSPAPLHVLISAAVTSRAHPGAAPGTVAETIFVYFSSSICYILQQQQQHVVCNTLLVHLCRSLGRHRGMLMGQGGNEAGPVVGSYQGSMGKEQDQGKLEIFLEALHNLLPLPVCSLENSQSHRNYLRKSNLKRFLPH